MLLGRWTTDIALEDVALDTINFWVQIRSFPPELITKNNIRKAAANAGEVLDVEWKDSDVLKSFSIPKALVKVKVKDPLCTGFSLSRNNGKNLDITFKYEKLATFCYDCGIIGHEQSSCTLEDPVDLEKFGPWLQFDEQNDISPAKFTAKKASSSKAYKTQRNLEAEMELAAQERGEVNDQNFITPKAAKFKVFTKVEMGSMKGLSPPKRIW